jgi:S-adenosylmethionine synthetase
VYVWELTDHFSAAGPFSAERPWCGSDVKAMGYTSGDEVDVVLCVPQKCAHAPNRAAYLENKQVVLAECGRLAKERLEDVPARFQLNVRDLPERDELYLTYTGSSIESGDEGVVGRGNRVNGMITPLRPMSVEPGPALAGIDPPRLPGPGG